MRLRLLPTLSLLTVSLLTPFAFRSQTADTVLLPPVVVTATLYPVSATASPVTVTVISGDALRAQGIATVADALRLVPGVAVVATGSYGGQTSLFLRGGESDYVKVLVDGVPQNQPGGSFDFANLGTEDVERIEVVRGPVSVLYGSDAVAGVVQVFTRSGGGPAAARLDFGAGSYGTEWGEAGVTGGGRGVQYSLSAARHTTSGIYAFNNDYRRDLIGGQLRLQPDSRTEARLVARYTEGVTHFPTDFTGAPADSDQNTSDRGPSLALELSRTLSPRLAAHVSADYHREVARFDDGQDSPGDTTAFCCFNSRDVARRLVVGGRADLHLTEATIVTAGVELERQRQGGTTLDTARSNNAAYVQALVGTSRAVSWTLGARVDDNQEFGRHVTGRAGLAWRPDVATRAHASAGTGFKEPSFFENFATGFTRGNPALEPEQSTSWEVGLSRMFAGGRLYSSITYFDQRFRDLIQYSPAPVGPDSVNYVNISGATARGLELGARATVSRGVSVAADYTVLSTRDQATGQRLLRRPSQTATVQLNVGWSRRWTASLAARMTGKRRDQDFTVFPDTSVMLPVHTVVDGSAEYRILSSRGAMPGLALNVRVTNMLNARYEEVLHFLTPRRAIFVGGRLDLAP